MSRHSETARALDKRIVVFVDDDTRVRQSLQSLLSSAGIETRGYSSAEEVLESGALDEASCLVTDIRMPGMDGWELQRRTSLAFPLLPLIFVTAHQDDQGFRKALSLGAFAFLYKPFDGEELLHAVEAALTSRAVGGVEP
jgi:FixJ family two-component response regulator